MATSDTLDVFFLQNLFYVFLEKASDLVAIS